MYYSTANKPQAAAQSLELHAKYPKASTKEYLGIKRAPQDKLFLASFCIYMLFMLITSGLAFYYGNFDALGKVVTSGNRNITECSQIDSLYAACTITCLQGEQLYLQRVCMTPNTTLAYAEPVTSLIFVYDIKLGLPTITYTTALLTIFSWILFGLILMTPQLLYILTAVGLATLLGLGFYILNSVQIRLTNPNMQGILVADELRNNIIAFALLAAYLIFFPYLLFQARKLKLAIKLIPALSSYFAKNRTLLLMSILMTFVLWGLTILAVLFIAQIYTTGTVTISSSSFFYTYTGLSMASTPLLVFYGFGLYWFFAVAIGFYKTLWAASTSIWYFENSESMYSMRRAFRRAVYQVGTVAKASLLLLPQMVIGVLFISLSSNKPLQTDGSLLPTENTPNTQVRDEIATSEPTTSCWGSFGDCLGQGISRLYLKCNSGSAVASALTNHNYQESCSLSAVSFALHSHKLSGTSQSIGYSLIQFHLGIWALFGYIALFVQFVRPVFPPYVSSIGVPLGAALICSLVIGTWMGTTLAAPVEAVCFCYLMEKKNRLMEGKDSNTGSTIQSKATARTIIQNCLLDKGEVESDESKAEPFQDELVV